MTDHDGGYKLLFAHRRMVADLLHGFIHEPWIDQIDLDTLERCEGSYVSDRLKRLEQDMVWRVRKRRGEGGSWLYVYLLLELQSRVERFMGVRVLAYVSQFYLDLVRRKELTPTGKLPPVLPIVLYNGRARWWAPQQVGDLIEDVPEGLGTYQPALKYLLLDQGEYSESELDDPQNLVSAVFLLEHSRDVDKVRSVVDTLTRRLEEPGLATLRRAFATWLAEVLEPARFSETEIPEIRDLEDARVMLKERVVEWTQEWLQEGERRGERKGERKGEQTMLLRLLEHKFGSVDEATRTRLAEADEEHLLAWGQRVLSAKRLQDVFA